MPRAGPNQFLGFFPEAHKLRLSLKFSECSQKKCFLKNGIRVQMQKRMCHCGTISGSLLEIKKIMHHQQMQQQPQSTSGKRHASSATGVGNAVNTHFRGADDIFLERRDLESFRKAFDRLSIPDSLERVVNQHMTVRLSGAEAIYRMLAVHGVKQVFGYSGGAVLPFIDQFHQHCRSSVPGSSYNQSRTIRFINTAHEQTASHAAQAVGRITGRPGVVVVTSGPGLTNCITAMQDALMDGDPMLVLSGQVPTSVMGTGAFQECPATALTKPCTKWNYLVENVESLPWAIDTALRIAMSGRKGPVHIDLPKNVLAGEGEIPLPFVCPGNHVTLLFRQRDFGEEAARRSNDRLIADCDEFLLDQIIQRVNKCERPIIIAGHGAVDAFQAVRAMAIKCSIPVATTLLGMGIFSELHPLSLRMLGMHGSAFANLAVQSADLILAIGTRFDDRTTGTLSTYAPKAKEAAKHGTGGIVHFEIESRQINKTVKSELSILADCRYSISRLSAYLPGKKHPEWLDQIATWKELYPFSWDRDSPPETFKTQEWTRPHQLITSGGLGTMGSGLPFAIGTQVVCPDHLVLLIDGDGSFNMTCSELATIKEFNLPIKIAIMNDGVQQMVRVWQHLFYNQRFLITTNSNPDYLSDSYGIPAMRCSNVNELENAALTLLTSDGPMLVDFQYGEGGMFLSHLDFFRVVPDFCLPMVKPGSALSEMLLHKSQIDQVPQNDPNFCPGNAPS